MSSVASSGLGSAFQVLCITHLPQIAAYADTHFVIDKQRRATVELSNAVAKLDESGRVEELARMLGGEAVTEGLRASAREMLIGRAHDDSGRSPETANKGRKAKAKGRKAKSANHGARDGVRWRANI